MNPYHSNIIPLTSQNKSFIPSHNASHFSLLWASTSRKITSSFFCSWSKTGFLLKKEKFSCKEHFPNKKKPYLCFGLIISDFFVSRRKSRQMTFLTTLLICTMGSMVKKPTGFEEKLFKHTVNFEVDFFLQNIS